MVLLFEWAAGLGVWAGLVAAAAVVAVLVWLLLLLIGWAYVRLRYGPGRDEGDES